MAFGAMLQFFFLAFAFYFPLSTSSPLPSLNYYDANSAHDQHIIREWYNMVKIPLDDTTSMQQLTNEAKDTTGKPVGSRMLEYLHRVMQWQYQSKCAGVPGLTIAECLTVQMYTDGFYIEYNQATTNRNWRPYRVYTTLMMSALRKLSKIDPVPPGYTLYRGINFKATPPTSKRIVWKALTSTSLNIAVAKQFAGKNGMIFRFKPPSSRFAAKVSKLSRYNQDEVLLFPFEAFDLLFVDKWGGFNFKTSKTQSLLAHSYCTPNSLEWACFRKGLCSAIAC